MKTVQANNPLFRLIRDYFMVYLPEQRCCSPHTIKSYRETLNQLFDFVTHLPHVDLGKGRIFHRRIHRHPLGTCERGGWV